MESVFLSYHFDPRSTLVPRVQEIIESHGLHIMTGVDLIGGQLSAEIQKRIKASDAVVSILSRDQPLQGKTFRAAQWVEEELSFARYEKKRAIAVVESSTEVSGMYAAHERIDAEPETPLEALMKLNRIIGLWKIMAGRTLQVRLEGDAVAKLYADKPSCHYRFMNGRVLDEAWQLAPLVPLAGGIFAFLKGASEDSRFQIKITDSKQRVWESVFTDQDLSAKMEERQ